MTTLTVKIEGVEDSEREKLSAAIFEHLHRLGYVVEMQKDGRRIAAPVRLPLGFHGCRRVILTDGV